MKKIYAAMYTGLLFAGLTFTGPLGCSKEEQKKPENTKEDAPAQNQPAPSAKRKEAVREVKQGGEKSSTQAAVRFRQVAREPQHLDIKPASPDDDVIPPPVEVPRTRTTLPPVSATVAPVENISPPPRPAAASLPDAPPMQPPVEQPETSVKSVPVTVEDGHQQPFQKYTDKYKRALPPSIERLKDGTISVRIGGHDEKNEEADTGTPVNSVPENRKSVTIGTPREPWQSRQAANANTQKTGTVDGGVAGLKPRQAESSSVTAKQQDAAPASSRFANQRPMNAPPLVEGTPPPVIPPPMALDTPIIQAGEPVLDPGPPPLSQPSGFPDNKPSGAIMTPPSSTGTRQ